MRLKTGQQLEGEVVDPGDREAVVHTGRGPVRLRGVVPGDRVRLSVTHVGKNAVWGRLEELLRPSNERTRPRCRHFVQCGGCPWQAWELTAQRREKRRRLVELLGGLGPPEVAEVAHAGDGYGHRNKILLPAGGRKGRLSFGLFEPRSHRQVHAGSCPVHDPAGEAALAALRRQLDSLNISPYDERTGRGVLRHVLVRVAPGTGQIGVCLYVKPWPLRRAQELGEGLLGIQGVVSVHAVHKPGDGGPAAPGVGLHLAGKPRLMVRVGEPRYLLTPTAFFQTNTPALPSLLEAVRAALPERVEHLLDLYAGVGLFALALAPVSGRVTAVESMPAAAGDLAAAARMQGLGHVDVMESDASLLSLLSPRPDAAIVDPPRAGLPPVLLRRLTGDLRPRHLVYVSCAPRALARDLAALTAAGYRIRGVQPVDLFPHTPHIETVVGLSRGHDPFDESKKNCYNSSILGGA